MQRIFRITWDGKQLTVSTLPKIAARRFLMDLLIKKLGKELMTQDEIAVMDGGKCILQLRGVRPFLSDKYDITKHPNYKYLSDFDKKNAFDVERYMSTRPAIVKPDEAFDIYEIDLSDEAQPPRNNGGIFIFNNIF